MLQHSWERCLTRAIVRFQRNQTRYSQSLQAVFASVVFPFKLCPFCACDVDFFQKNPNIFQRHELAKSQESHVSS